MDFRPLSEVERAGLKQALQRNADSDVALLMDRRNTRFAGIGYVTDEEVIDAVKSIPMHY